ncbi:hypothetical protein M432DRAFT_602932 [Thermoascus aurantiacus ATCC 26904]
MSGWKALFMFDPVRPSLSLSFGSALFLVTVSLVAAIVLGCHCSPWSYCPYHVTSRWSSIHVTFAQLLVPLFSLRARVSFIS